MLCYIICYFIYCAMLYLHDVTFKCYLLCGYIVTFIWARKHSIPTEWCNTCCSVTFVGASFTWNCARNSGLDEKISWKTSFVTDNKTVSVLHAIVAVLGFLTTSAISPKYYIYIYIVLYMLVICDMYIIFSWLVLYNNKNK